MLEPEKVAKEYSICHKCKFDGTELCMGCTTFAGTAPVLICGIACGTIPMFYHSNFEPKRK